MKRASLLFVAALALPSAAVAQQVQPIVHTLENGMTLLLLPRPGDPNISAGWVAKVGSVTSGQALPGLPTCSST